MDEQESKRILEESLKNLGKPKKEETEPPEPKEPQEEGQEDIQTEENLNETEPQIEYEHLTDKKPLFIGLGVTFLVLVGISLTIFYYGFSDENLPNSRDIAAKQLEKMLTAKEPSNQIQQEKVPEKMETKAAPQKGKQKEIPVKNPKEKTISEEESYTEEIISLIETWESSWENGNFDKFINLYSKDFNSDGMNFNAWSKKKSRSLRNKGIQVGVSDLKIVKQGEILIVTFIQNYKSKTISDVGKKTMKFKKENGSYKIFSEKWKKIG